MPEFLKVKPEARFSHYLMMIGALGEEKVIAPGRLFGKYENSIGTGQVHVWFDRPESGWHLTEVSQLPKLEESFLTDTRPMLSVMEMS